MDTNTWSKMPQVDTLEGLVEFVAVVEAGSISGAASALGVPRESVGRHLAQLEERLGVRLLHRTTRKVTPSQAGSELYARARRIVAEGAAAVEAVRRLDGVPRGTLRVTLPPSDINANFAEMLRTFALAYPQVELEVLSVARFVDLVAEGFDVAVRAGTVHDPSLVTRTLGHSELIAVASPAYLEARGTPRSLDELDGHECLRSFDARTSRPRRTWPLKEGGEVEVHGRIATSDLPVLIRLALEGFGIAVVPEMGVRAAMAEGRLRRVLDEVGGSGPISVVYPEREFLDPKVRAFVDHVVAFFEEWLLPSLDPCARRR